MVLKRFQKLRNIWPISFPTFLTCKSTMILWDRHLNPHPIPKELSVLRRRFQFSNLKSPFQCFPFVAICLFYRRPWRPCLSRLPQPFLLPNLLIPWGPAFRFHFSFNKFQFPPLVSTLSLSTSRFVFNFNPYPSIWNLTYLVQYCV